MKVEHKQYLDQLAREQWVLEEEGEDRAGGGVVVLLLLSVVLTLGGICWLVLG